MNYTQTLLHQSIMAKTLLFDFQNTRSNKNLLNGMKNFPNAKNDMFLALKSSHSQMSRKQYVKKITHEQVRRRQATMLNNTICIFVHILQKGIWQSTLLNTECKSTQPIHNHED